jgi:hypothetical protein
MEHLVFDTHSGIILVRLVWLLHLAVAGVRKLSQMLRILPVAILAVLARWFRLGHFREPHVTRQLQFTSQTICLKTVWAKKDMPVTNSSFNYLIFPTIFTPVRKSQFFGIVKGKIS